MARCPREGLRVRFEPSAGALMLYGEPYPPRRGTVGTTTSLPVPGGRRTCMPGPRGGLVYVQFPGHGTMGVFKNDLVTGARALGGARRRRR